MNISISIVSVLSIITLFMSSFSAAKSGIEQYKNADQMLLDLARLTYLKYDKSSKGPAFDKQADIFAIEKKYAGWDITYLSLGKGFKADNLSDGAIVASKYDQASKTFLVNMAFRGTRDSDDWTTNLSPLKKYLIFKDMKIKPEFLIIYEQGQVHAGFLNAYNTVAQRITDILMALHQKIPTARFKIRISGHSLGGALATIAAAHIDLFLLSIGKREPDNIQLETYASPKVFGEKLATALSNRLGEDNIVRIVSIDAANDKDIISRLPKNVALQRYQHAGKECLVHLDKKIDPKARHGLAKYVEAFISEPNRVCH